MIQQTRRFLGFIGFRVWGLGFGVGLGFRV